MNFAACRLASSIYIDGVSLVYTKKLRFALAGLGLWDFASRAPACSLLAKCSKMLAPKPLGVEKCFHGAERIIEKEIEK